jgi:hypothetical protein
MYRAMVKEGSIESETNTTGSREQAIVISYECRRHLYFIDSPLRMPEMTSRAMLLAPYLVHTPL